MVRRKVESTPCQTQTFKKLKNKQIKLIFTLLEFNNQFDWMGSSLVLSWKAGFPYDSIDKIYIAHYTKYM